jgi:hypothetical protein
MTKRVARTGGMGGMAPSALMTPASAMPLLRGVTAGAIH